MKNEPGMEKISNFWLIDLSGCRFWTPTITENRGALSLPNVYGQKNGINAFSKYRIRYIYIWVRVPARYERDGTYEIINILYCKVHFSGLLP